MKKINRYIPISILLVAGTLLFSSCKKFLTEDPSSQFTADFVYNTAEGLESGVVGLYNIHRSFYTRNANNGSDAIVIDSRDDLTIPRGGEISLYGRMSRGTTPENSGVFSTYWRHYYQIVDRANGIIKAAEKLSNIENGRRNKILAEAKFFRANSVFTLYKLFNNIYVTTEPTTPENALNIVLDKTPEADIYKLINEDLSFAIANLDWTTTQTGRITQATARHVKAEVALWQKNWTEAKAQSEAVLNHGAYKLVASPAGVFAGELKNSEILWALQFKRGVDGDDNRINFNLMPNYAEQIPGSKYSVEQGGRGFAWLTINNYLRDLLNAYPNDIRVNGTYYIKDYYYNDPATVPNPALLGTKIVHPLWQEFAASSTNRNFWFIPTENNHYKNISMARLAETFLFAAEANLMLNNIGTVADAPLSGTALGQLNAVRSRAGIPKASAINMDSILNEQAKELAFEGRRMYMLKRTGRLYDYVRNHAGYGMAGDLSPDNSTAGGANNTPAKPLPYRSDARRNMMPFMVNWPIPIAEINLLGPNYPQNAGY
jgi:starch-binding outer membrane protein, SusD/RagB family